jgi:protoporphyrinogen/coproporphyrinogen III oxidase
VPHVVVVGGGIAGLTVAHRLTRDAGDRAIEVTVLEADDRLGGTIYSAHVDGYVCEHGPQAILDNSPDTLTLIRELGLKTVASAPTSRRRYLFRGGHLREVPRSPLSALTSGVLSWKGKLRLAGEPLIRPTAAEDEAIAAFAARRIGPEAAQALVDPMVSGIYAGDAAQLSMRAAFPAIWQLERDHGSLLRGMFAQRGRRRSSSSSAPRLGRLVSFAEGIEALPAALARALGARVRIRSRVTGLERIAASGGHSDGSWHVSIGNGGELDADHVVIAGHPAMASGLTRGFDPELGALLDAIPSAPVAVIALGYTRSAILHPLDGFGFLVPRSEGLRTLGVLWESSIFPARAPLDHVLLRVMIGGAHDPSAVALDDDTLLAIARDDLQRALGISAAPALTYVVRHSTGIPQCTLGHPARMARLEAALGRWPGLHLTGWGYRGVSINSGIAEASAVAATILKGCSHLAVYNRSVMHNI